MKRGLLIDYLDRFELLLDDEDSVYASTENLKGVKSLSFDNCSEVFGERVDDYVRYKSVNIKEETETSVVVENEKFFVDYDAIKCNCREFDLLKHRLHEDGWKWFNGHNKPKQSLLNETPNHLALIQANDKRGKTLIAYFEDELEFFDIEKEAKELIREYNLKKLGIE